MIGSPGVMGSWLIVNIPAMPARRLVAMKQMILTRSVLIPQTCAASLLPPVANSMAPHRVRFSRISTTIIAPSMRKKVKEMPSGFHEPMIATSGGRG